jgi:Effector Associated Constant Component 1
MVVAGAGGEFVVGELRITVEPGAGGGEEGAEEDELTELYQWLADDPELRLSGIELTREERDDAGTMGLSLDAINVLLSNSISLGGLILSYRAWRDSRSKPPKIRIQADGEPIDPDADPEAGVRADESAGGGPA